MITAVQAVLYVSIAVAAGAALWASFFGRTLRRMLLGLAVSAGALIVAGIAVLASTGVLFCNPPPGSGCA